jgi:acetyltransferase-like isoleucine patch superfamily enzyme
MRSLNTARISSASSNVIERSVWIAAGATIIGGGTVGENSVVAAGAVVTGTFPQVLLSEEIRRELFVRLVAE